jgi:hypothetical protein
MNNKHIFFLSEIKQEKEGGRESSEYSQYVPTELFLKINC